MNKFLLNHWKSLSVWAILIAIFLSVALPITAQVAGNSVLFRRAEDTWALINMTTGAAQKIEIYNSNDTSPFTNYEKVTMGWVGNQFTTTYASSGTGAASRVIQAMSYSNSGTANAGHHFVVGTVTSSSGLATVSFSNSSVYNSSVSYYCTTNDETGKNYGQLTKSSGTQFVITGTGSDVYDYICDGT